MILGLLKEHGDETRVALLPDNVQQLVNQHVEVLVESGAGNLAFVSDNDYISAGAKIVDRKTVFEKSSILLQIQVPLAEDVKKIQPSQVWISAFNPLWETALVKTFQEKQISGYCSIMSNKTGNVKTTKSIFKIQ